VKSTRELLFLRMTKTKLVVRHLPPDMTEEAFNQSIEEFKDEFTWSYFHQGKARPRVEWSRLGVAYLNLKDPNRVHVFSSKMVGRVFQVRFLIKRPNRLFY